MTSVPVRNDLASVEAAIEAHREVVPATAPHADGFTVVELQAIRDQYEERLRTSEARREEVEFRARQALARLGDAIDALRAAVGDDAAILRRPLAGPARARA